LEGLHKLGPWDAIPIPVAGEQLNALARRVADSREEIALTDEDEKIVALMISPAVLEDLEDELAITRAELRTLKGEEGFPHEDVVREIRGEAP
jgi:PHD/YefM family antitoxin component YafN of YafNO toxin-antitoxin module